MQNRFSTVQSVLAGYVRFAGKTQLGWASTPGTRRLPPKSFALPAAGYRNNDNLNNVGSNGNYWSSSLHTDNPNNAYNVNFNSSNINRNNNNRYNGQSVRPVSEPMLVSNIPGESSDYAFLPPSISREQLLLDLYRAYRDARRHKRYRPYQLQFERNLEANLVRLRDAIWARRYKPGPSTCFIIHDPKTREVFAASFRDRVVHHLFFNYAHEAFESGFIQDSYSCIKGRGTHFGIERLRKHILDVSAGFSRPCFVLKMDIKGYFMNIDRARLLEICRRTLASSSLPADSGLVDYLLRCIEPLDPTDGCFRVGRTSDWKMLPNAKSLFFSAPGCGLPIGNLTSQLFSNVYLGAFDDYMVHTLGLQHYGRYVDDFYIVASSKALLRKIIPVATSFLKRQLGLDVNMNKTQIRSAYMGVEFLGAYLKPWRTYVGCESLRRMLNKLLRLASSSPDRVFRSMNSYLGVLSHYSSYRIRSGLVFRLAGFSFRYGYYTNNVLTFRLCKLTSTKSEELLCKIDSTCAYDPYAFCGRMKIL